MSKFKSTALALAIVGSMAAVSAQAAPVASAEAVVSFENFQIFWQSSGNQLDANVDFSSLSATSSQEVSANLEGNAGVTVNKSSSNGSDIVAQAINGTLDAGITGFPVAANTVFNVVDLPMTGNFSASGSNETGSPILNFGVATTNANLHNASYASLDSLNGTAGTGTSSQLASTMKFVLADGVESDVLVLQFDLGAYIGAFLSEDAAQSASASWSVSFVLADNTAGTLVLDSAITDNRSNNEPGSGIVHTGFKNTGLTGDKVTVVTQQLFTAPLVAGHEYELTATISTRAQVERRQSIPEPGALTLLGLGLAALGFSRRRKTA